MAPANTSPWAGLSEMTAVASTVDARSKVSAPEVVICPEGVTVTAGAEAALTAGGAAGTLAAADSSAAGPGGTGAGRGDSQAVAAVAGSSVMFLGASFLPGAAGSSFSFLRRL